ncbi:MAG: response regulator [Pseudomonadota bacterium]|nr:response regulator [Pseudomonadota bacterium]
MRPLRPPVLLSLLSCFVLLVAPARAEPPRLASATWTLEDGLPVNSVNDIEVTRDGYVWLATFDGLVRFDGVRFTVFGTENTPGLTSNRITSVAEAPDGALWLRTEPGRVVRRDPATGAVRSWDLGAGERGPTLIFGRSGTVWASARQGVARFDGDDFEVIPLVSEGEADVEALAEEPGGALWIATERGGVARIPGAASSGAGGDAAGTRWFGVPEGLDTTPTTSVAIGPDGTVWVCSHTGVYRLREGRFVALESGGAAWREDFVSIVPTGADEAWVIAQTGLFHWKDGVAVTMDRADAARPPIRTSVATDADGHTWALSRTAVLRDGEIVVRSATGDPWTDIALAPEGGVWVGSGGGGLLRLRDAAIETLGRALTPALPKAYGLAAGADGAVWVGSQRGGLTRIGADGVRTWAAAEGLHRNVGAVLEEPDGTVWAGANGVHVKVGDRFEPVPEAPTGTVRMIELRRDGSVLVAARDQLWEERDGAWTRLDEVLGLPNAPVRAMLETDDTLWLGTNGAGLLRVAVRAGGELGDVTRLGRAEGFPSDTVRAVWISPAGTLWVGTEDVGIWGMPLDAGGAGGPPRTFSQPEGLPDHSVHALVPDTLGALWGSTNRGLFRVPVAELDAFARGSDAPVHVESFGRGDGMEGAEANGGFHRAGLRTADGRIWFASMDGVVVVRPGRVRVDAGRATARVESLRLDGLEQPLFGPRTLSPSERSFGIDYTALPAMYGEKQRFWYRLDGVDPDWVDAGTRRTAWYTQVPPGERTFRVRTSPPDHEGTEATLTLHVVPRFHETAWFRALVALLATGAAVLAVWSRLAAARRRERVLEERVRARTADLAAEKELAVTAGRTIAAQAARLLEVDRLKTRFFQDLSHELRTPLTLVIGPLEDVRTGRHGGLPAAVEAQVGLAERNARRLFALVNQLLDLVRLDAGMLRLERTPQDLVALVAGVAEVHQPLADRRSIALQLDLPAEPCIVDFDRRELEKVYANLLGNALKFTPSHGRVEVVLRAGDTEVEVTIRDSGPGLSAEVRERLFERFYSPGESSVQAGSGIGLSLARDLTERHDGRIRVESVEGHGSTFTVVLPRSRAVVGAPGARRPEDRAVPAPPVPEVEDIAGPESSGEDRTTVLVVDDHPEVRAWIRGHLAPRYQVLEAANGREGLATARRALPDLVVSDVMMPEMNGYELVRALRADPDLEAVPVVLLTAKGSDESRIEGLRGGADVYLTKPFASQVLVAQVDGLIAQRRLLRERVTEAARAAPPATGELDEEHLSADERYIRKVRAAIDAQLHDPAFGVQELADAVAQDRAHLFRRVKQLTGEAPSNLLRVARLERAATLLARRVASVGEIAYAVGFNGISHFSKSFRDHYGVTPTAWATEGRGEAAGGGASG